MSTECPLQVRDGAQPGIKVPLVSMYPAPHLSTASIASAQRPSARTGWTAPPPGADEERGGGSALVPFPISDDDPDLVGPAQGDRLVDRPAAMVARCPPRETYSPIPHYTDGIGVVTECRDHQGYPCMTPVAQGQERAMFLSDTALPARGRKMGIRCSGAGPRASGTCRAAGRASSRSPSARGRPAPPP